jgi:hypothetical protein
MWNVLEGTTVFANQVQDERLFVVQFKPILQQINLDGLKMDKLLVEMDLRLLLVFLFVFKNYLLTKEPK